MSWARPAAVLAALLPALAWADRTVTLVFTGDNAGEVAPCGCQNAPSGGFPRRKAALEAWRDENVVVLDSGNALFRSVGVDDAPRAALTFGFMERLGTRAMAVGPKDLSAGVDRLLQLGRGASMKLLSANLTRGGQPIFAGGAVFQAGEVKVGVIALTASGRYGDAEAGPVLPAAKAALAALGPRDVTVVLAAIPYAESLTLARQLPEVDFILQSGDARGTGAPQREGDAGPLVLSSAQRGQALGKAVVSLGSPRSPLVDLTVVARDRQQLAFVDGQVGTLEARAKKAADKQAAREFSGMLRELKQRQATLRASIARVAPPGASTFDFSWTVLSSAWPDDEGWKAEVLKVEPSYAY